ncbi:dTMP kinase [Propioniciclava soli]|uniref:Thymidylate kinase n=1 Tax=Propioniciclava soli TaxID=2775081 RepID=A0ABZ3CA11_9ACTN
MRGIFIVFEGGDGVGKSTQAELLTAWLTSRGREVVRTFEPGDGPVNAQIRRILLSRATENLSPRAEALLFAADKAQHVDALVRPALARGAVVVSDRYVDSTLAYQGAGRVLELAEVERVNRWATDDLRPDLTVLLDLDPTLGLAGIADADRMEAAGGDFHARVRAGFLALAERDPARYLVLPARDSREAIADAVRVRVAALLGPDASGRAASDPKLSDAPGRLST